MIFLELVPRDLDRLLLESQRALSQFPALTGINVPDVSRIEIRSHEAAGFLQDHQVTSIPHIRACDRSIPEAIEIVTRFVARGGTSVLIVNGDAIAGKLSSGVSTVSLIQALRKSFPSLNIYGALDPYRQSLKQELAYCREKVEAGATGLFTQPFFDLRVAELFLEQLTYTKVFLGASPVLTEKSLMYWTDRNHVVFPPSFELGMAANAFLASQLIRLADRFAQHVYLMPITCDSILYLDQVFLS